MKDASGSPEASLVLAFATPVFESVRPGFTSRRVDLVDVTGPDASSRSSIRGPESGFDGR
tara:strand:- start:1577 stop:1756 length:180 start_codon:yes stop_codon:yes gene_type:complete